MIRKPDLGRLFRPHRIYSADGVWYIATREGERGPFPTKQLAELDLKNYRRRKKGSTDPRQTEDSHKDTS
jgi:hypothetical protein